MNPTVAMVVALVSAAGVLAGGFVFGAAVIWRLSSFKTAMERDIAHLGTSLGAQIADLKGGTKETEVDLDELCDDVATVKADMAGVKADVKNLNDRWNSRRDFPRTPGE